MDAGVEASCRASLPWSALSGFKSVVVILAPYTVVVRSALPQCDTNCMHDKGLGDSFLPVKNQESRVITSEANTDISASHWQTCIFRHEGSPRSYCAAKQSANFVVRSAERDVEADVERWSCHGDLGGRDIIDTRLGNGANCLQVDVPRGFEDNAPDIRGVVGRGQAMMIAIDLNRSRSKSDPILSSRMTSGRAPSASRIWSRPSTSTSIFTRWPA